MEIDPAQIPQFRERRFPPRHDPPDAPRAATAVLKALQPGQEALIDSAVFALAVELAAVEAGVRPPVCRMTPAQQSVYRKAERRYLRALPKLTRPRMRMLCLALGGVEPEEALRGCR
jgi:hypothetical protein